MKPNLALKVKAPPKPTTESFANEKLFYEDWENSNSCCLIIMENHMKEFIYASIPKIENVKELLILLERNIQSFQRMIKKSYLIIIT